MPKFSKATIFLIALTVAALAAPAWADIIENYNSDDPIENSADTYTGDTTITYDGTDMGTKAGIWVNTADVTTTISGGSLTVNVTNINDKEVTYSNGVKAEAGAINIDVGIADIEVNAFGGSGLRTDGGVISVTADELTLRLTSPLPAPGDTEPDALEAGAIYNNAGAITVAADKIKMFAAQLRGYGIWVGNNAADTVTIGAKTAGVTAEIGISTTGEEAFGIRHDNGTVSITGDTTITTTGAAAMGVRAKAGTLTFDGDLAINTSGGIKGVGSFGLRKETSYGLWNTTASGGGTSTGATVKVTGNTNITTSGEGAHAVFNQTNAADGDNDYGISFGGDATLAATGEGADGLHVTGGKVAFSGAANISSAQGHAVAVSSFGIGAPISGEVELNNGGVISAPTGDGAIGEEGHHYAVYTSKGGQVTGTGKFDISGDIYATGDGSVTNLALSNASAFKGTAFSDNRDGLSLSFDEGSVWTMTGSSVIDNLKLLNGSRIVYATDDYGTLTVINDVTSDNTGIIVLRANLIGEDSQNDKLIVDDSGGVSGITQIHLVLSGTGDLPVNGLPLVEFDDNTTIAEDNFVVGNRPSLKSGKYGLEQDDINTIYLRYQGVIGDVAAYAGSAAAAMVMQQHQMHDRFGDAPADGYGGLWVRVDGGVQKQKLHNRNFKNETKLIEVQLGGDVAAFSLTGGGDRLHLGLMGGYSHAKVDSDARHDSDSAKSNVDGYYVGAYATWFADSATRKGFYADGWLLAGWQQHTMKGDYIKKHDFDSRTFSLAVEAGYAITPLASNPNFTITPKAQFVWTHLSLDKDYEKHGGEYVTTDKNDAYFTTVGVRAHYNLRLKGGCALEPFAEVNWRHAGGDPKLSLSGDKFDLDLPKDSVELKLGLNGQVNDKFSLWGEVAGELGGRSSKGIYGQVGFRYTFN